MRLNGTNACVVNGNAFGPGFGFCTGQGLIRTLPTKDALSDWLLEVVGRQATLRQHTVECFAAVAVARRLKFCCIPIFDELFSEFS